MNVGRVAAGPQSGLMIMARPFKAGSIVGSIKRRRIATVDSVGTARPHMHLTANPLGDPALPGTQ